MNDIEKLSSLIEKISEKKEIVFRNGYPEYPSEIMVILSVCGGGSDKDYLAHIDAIKDREIRELNKKEIATYMTYILRGERFSDGHIAAYIENGIILSLAKRFLEIQRSGSGNETL